MNEQARKIRVSGRTDRNRHMDPGSIPNGHEIEAEYHAASGPDRDAVLAFVERLVRIWEGAENTEGKAE